MGTFRTRRLTAAAGLFWAALPAAADDLPPLPATEKPPAVASKGSAAHEAAPKPAGEVDPARADLAAFTAEIKGRLDKLPRPADKEATAATKALREVLEDRLRWVEEWDKAVKERLAAENPEPRPEAQAARWKDDLARVNAALDQASKDPAALLPADFRNLPADVPESARSAMKDAIEAAQAELKKWSAEREQLRSEPPRKEGSAALAAVRASRDKTYQRLAALKARNPERDAGLADAKTPEARALAREALINFQWEARVEAERLRGQDALLTLEGKRSELAALNLQVLEAHVRLAQTALDRMKARYRTLAARQERDLHQAAVKEQTRAEKVDDPLERYRASRTAELLELEARVLRAENALATSPPPSLEEQRALADRAETDFTNVKHLLDDGRVSHLDALRLNNDFRRIGPERARIVRNELAVSAGRLTTAENALSTVEMELIYDARDDRYELESLLERLPRRLHARATAVCNEFERKHTALLNRRRAALEKLAARAEQTHEQVLRRLRILDDHFGFIRTHIFWVRDEEPVGPATVAQAQRELVQIGRAGVRVAAEVCDPKTWDRLTPEFLAAALGLVVLPWPLQRARRALRPIAAASRPVSSEAQEPRSEDQG